MERAIKKKPLINLQNQYKNKAKRLRVKCFYGEVVKLINAWEAIQKSPILLSYYRKNSVQKVISYFECTNTFFVYFKYNQ